MKNTLLTFLILFSFFMANNPAHANTAAGGELIYVHIADSTYHFFIKLYRDCSGNAEPASLPLCLRNTCTNQVVSLTAAKWVGSTPGNQDSILGPACKIMKTNCDSIASPIQAYEEAWYAAIATLPARCSNWKFSTHIANRSTANNIQNSTTGSLYLEATMNNHLTDSNSSPYYSVRPVYAVPHNWSYTYNSGVIEPDGDSLWTDVIMPRTGVSTCGDTAVNTSLATASPAYNLVNNPFQTNNSFNLNHVNGQMNFTAAILGKNTIAIRTREYRNGVLIGSVMREMPMQVLFLPSPPVILDTVDIDDVPQWANGFVYGCTGQQLQIPIDYKSSDTNSRLYVSDNALTSIPGMTANYTNQGTDSVRAVFTWTPTPTQTGNFSMIVLVADSVCNGPGVVLQYAKYVDIRIWGKTVATKDTTICAGEYAFLKVSGGGDYEWKELPSGNSSTTVSNPNIANPVAFPTKTTTYQVVSTINTFCPNLNKDTVVVNVRPTTAGANSIQTSFGCGQNPVINYINSCPGQPISFCFQTSSTDTAARLRHFNNALSIMPGATITYTTQGTNTTTGTFSWTPQPNQVGSFPLVLSSYDSACVSGNAPHLKEQHIGIIIWAKPQITADTIVCQGDTVQLKVTSGGLKFRWDYDLSIIPPVYSNPDTKNPTATIKSETRVIVTALDNIYCPDNKDSLIIKVNLLSHPSVNITASPGTNVPYGTPVTFTAQVANCNNPYYTWYKNGQAITGLHGASIGIYQNENMQQYWCGLACNDICASPKDTTSNKITMHITTGVQDINETSGISISPNPNTGTFTLDVKDAGKIHLLEIYDITGRCVYKSATLGKKEVLHINAAPGIYSVKIMSDQRVYNTKMVVR